MASFDGLLLDVGAVLVRTPFENVAGAEAVGIPAVHFDPTDVAGSFRLVRGRLALDP